MGKTRTDIKLLPSTDVNTATIDLLKQLVRTRTDIKLQPSGYSIYYQKKQPDDNLITLACVFTLDEGKDKSREY